MNGFVDDTTLAPHLAPQRQVGQVDPREGISLVSEPRHPDPVRAMPKWPGISHVAWRFNFAALCSGVTVKGRYQAFSKPVRVQAGDELTVPVAGVDESGGWSAGEYPQFERMPVTPYGQSNMGGATNTGTMGHGYLRFD